MKLFHTILVLLVLLLAVMPAAAQDVFQTNTPPGDAVVADPTVEATAPVVVVDDTGGAWIPADLARELYLTAINQFGNVFVLVLGIGALVLLGLGIPAFYYIYKSTPAAFRPMVKEAALGILTTAENELKRQMDAAKTNDIDWDDDIWLTLYREAKAKREALAALGTEPAKQIVTG